MSWHWSGLIQLKAGTLPAARSASKFFSNGTTRLSLGLPGELTSEKYMNGLCFCAYSFTVVPLTVGAYSPPKPACGIDCMYAFQDRPFASNWSTRFFPENMCDVLL